MLPPEAQSYPGHTEAPRRVAGVRRTVTMLAAAALLAAGGCSTRHSGTFLGPTGAPGAASSGVPSGPPGGPGADSSADPCPAAQVEPDPHRPKITLAFDLAAGLSTVTGTEHVEFTPDLPVREVVFRLTANTPSSAQVGNRIRVTSATAAPGGQAFTVDRGGAGPGTQGGILVIPLEREVPAGTAVTADVAFTLTLGAGSFDRFGQQDGFAWWGSGQPLLAWERGVGWHREPMARFVAESATSEAAAVDLTVTAPSGLVLLASGSPDGAGTAAGDGRTRWHWVADRARDVAVSAGPFKTAERTVDGVRVIVGTPANDDPAQLLAKHVAAVRGLEKLYGPFPFPVLSVARLPISGGGIEYPGSIMMLEDSTLVAVHETAHQYFYAMVGDSQWRDPWLDEAFATYSEVVVDGVSGVGPGNVDTGSKVGDSLGDFGDDDGRYYATVYERGSAALLAARKAVGPAAFDRALRCYVNKNAWRIARPADLAAALDKLPKAVAVLEKAGALP
jgi:Peptidase family M1 domain